MAQDGAGRLLLFGALVCAAGYSLVGRPRRAAASTVPRGRMADIPITSTVPRGRMTDIPITANTSSAGPPSVEQWATMLAPGCLANRIQLPYALKWVDLESG